jgi:hypothetical protein
MLSDVNFDLVIVKNICIFVLQSSRSPLQRDFATFFMPLNQKKLPKV